MVQKSRVCACGSVVPENKFQCPGCGKWLFTVNSGEDFDSFLMSDIKRGEIKRIKSGPWDYVFGGGLTSTGVVLMGGSPGAGKTTLTLMMAKAFPPETAFIAAEQSKEEIADYGDRLKLTEEVQKKIRIIPAMSGVDVGSVLQKCKPKLLILDSLQGIAGKDSQLQLSICRIVKVQAVKLGCPGIIISHVTKDELLAGDMDLQHEVDVTAMFYAEENTRILTVFKSRIGPAFYECVFDMTERGLKHIGNRKPGDDQEENESDSKKAASNRRKSRDT